MEILDIEETKIYEKNKNKVNFLNLPEDQAMYLCLNQIYVYIKLEYLTQIKIEFN